MVINIEEGCISLLLSFYHRGGSTLSRNIERKKNNNQGLFEENNFAPVWKLVEDAIKQGKKTITWNELKSWFRKKKIRKDKQPDVTAFLLYKIKKENLPISIVYSNEKADNEAITELKQYISKRRNIELSKRKIQEQEGFIKNSKNYLNEKHFDIIDKLAPQFAPFLDPHDIVDRLEKAIQEAQETFSWKKPYRFDDWVWYFACDKMHKIIQRRKRKKKTRGTHITTQDISHFKYIADKNGLVTEEDIISYYGSDSNIDKITERLIDEGINFEESKEEDNLFTEIHTYSRIHRTLGLVQTYLQEIGQVNLLTADQEKSLAQKIEEYQILSRKVELIEKRNRGEELTDEEIEFLKEHGDELSDDWQWELEVLREEAEYAWERLIISNLRLVVSIAKKYTGKGMDFMDLVQEGTIGLMKAVEKFEWRRGYKFSTYATWWIRQAITRALADQSRTIRIPVHMVETRNKYLRVRQELYHQLGREPTTEEIAEAMGIDVEKVRDIETTIQEPKSLESTIGDDEDTHLGDFIEDTKFEKPEEYMLRKEIKEKLKSVINELPERERDILKLRYGLEDGRERSLEEVAQHFGITRERVRQIIQKAEKKLRSPHKSKKLRKLVQGGL